MSRKKMNKWGMVAMAMVLSFMVSMTSVFADTRQVSNELEMQFNVQKLVYNNIVELTWDGTDQTLKSIDSKLLVAQSVSYQVGAGSDFTDDPELSTQYVDVLLKITDANPEKIQAVTVGGNAVSPMSDLGTNYYVLRNNLEISNGMTAVSGNFSITFNALTSGSPFTASIIAVEHVEQLLNHPGISVQTDYSDGQTSLAFVLDVMDYSWWSKITEISVSKDDGVNYIPMNLSDPSNSNPHFHNGVITLSEEATEFAPDSSTIKYRIKATGYKDYEYTFNQATG